MPKKSIYKSFDELPIVLNVEDVESVLGIARSSSYNLFRSEEFPSFRVGKRFLVKRDDFLDWMNKKVDEREE